MRSGSSIPDWTGGLRRVPRGWETGGRRIDPFADDRKLFSIDASNVSQHADKLSPGQLALFRELDGYRMDVYETRRSCAYPEWVYETTKRNAVSARLDKRDVYLAKGWHPYLFPIPRNGAEAIWNFQYAFFAEGKLKRVEASGGPVSSTRRHRVRWSPQWGFVQAACRS